MAWIGVPTTPPPKEPKERSQDLENLLGNYLITDHQLTRLRTRIADYIKTNQNASTFMFRSDDSKRWYKVNVVVEDITPEAYEADEVTDSGDTAPPLPAPTPVHEPVGMIDDDIIQ